MSAGACPVGDWWRVEELVNENTLKLMSWHLERNLRPLLRVLRHMGFDTDDVIQEASILLIRCRLSRACSHTTYVCKAVYFSGLNMLNKKRPPLVQVKSWENTIANPVYAIDNRDHTESLMERLTDQERIVMERRYWGYQVLEEIGNHLGVTRERVRQIEASALKKMAEV